ncbi:hypothetical protein RJ639_045125 [Escallonia herrerae]|uniref:Zinc knuckle CX2CX4HX4C domain-containing protein n=1 Tax=Escallonia herrerae TaxID=1293975 RepID=A0AA89AXU8_9ASTE|nr:hypothetical protein RJ639_045125 [Escallonia herrerae]
MKIQPLEDYKLCITFNHEWDRSRVLDSRPWSVMSSHLVVRDWPPDLSMEEIEFNTSSFWIRICGLPPNQMTKRKNAKITESIGSLKEVDFTSNGRISWFKYLRIRVEIDIRHQLQTGFNRNKEANQKAWIQLQYEQLPDFYFNCGRLGRVGRTCPFPPLKVPKNMSNSFRPWLRADDTESLPPGATWNPYQNLLEN